MQGRGAQHEESEAQMDEEGASLVPKPKTE